MRAHGEVDGREGVISDSSRQGLIDLFEAHFDALYRFCLARTGDVASADDAASEAFLAAARVFAAGRGGAVDRPWLFVVARRRMVDQWRASERQRHRIERLVRLRRPEKSETVLNEAISDLSQKVVEALGSLPTRQRAALTLRYLDEYSVAEVAERLDIGYQAAESLLARARRSFAMAWEHSSG